jgi:hypothetical protein
VVQERILAWVKACELRIALVKNDDLFLHLLWWCYGFFPNAQYQNALSPNAFYPNY